MTSSDWSAVKKRLQFCEHGHRLAGNADIEALIAEVERLQALNDKQARMIEGYQGDEVDAEREVARLQAELEQARAQVAELDKHNLELRGAAVDLEVALAEERADCASAVDQHGEPLA